MQEAGIQMAGIQTAGAQTVRKSEFGNASLIFTATLIWGTAFVAQSLGANHLAAFSFTAVRNLIGFLFLIPVTLLFRARGISVRPERENRPDNVFIPGRRGQRALVTKRELISGSILGVIVFVASNVQQLGIAGTTTAKAGFFTAMYVIFVPVLGIFPRQESQEDDLGLCTSFCSWSLSLVHKGRTSLFECQ